MNKPYFIMIHNQRGTAVLPMTCEEGEEVAMFGTIDEATEAANTHDMCIAFGWDLFQVGCGIDGGDGL